MYSRKEQRILPSPSQLLGDRGLSVHCEPYSSPTDRLNTRIPQAQSTQTLNGFMVGQAWEGQKLRFHSERKTDAKGRIVPRVSAPTPALNKLRGGSRRKPRARGLSQQSRQHPLSHAQSPNHQLMHGPALDKHNSA